MMQGPASSLVLFLVSLVILTSCGSSREVESSGSATETLHRFETEFDPTRYNPDMETFGSEAIAKGADSTEQPVGVSNVASVELVQGFRVQLYASTGIDQTSKQKRHAEDIFPAEWFYMVYDPPTYKLRGGNFVTRFEADRFLKELKEAGFRDSWIVPDRVVQNPEPRTTPVPEENK